MRINEEVSYLLTLAWFSLSWASIKLARLSWCCGGAVGFAREQEMLTETLAQLREWIRKKGGGDVGTEIKVGTVGQHGESPDIHARTA